MVSLWIFDSYCPSAKSLTIFGPLPAHHPTLALSALTDRIALSWNLASLSSFLCFMCKRKSRTVLLFPIKNVCSCPQRAFTLGGEVVIVHALALGSPAEVTQSSEWTFVLMASQEAVGLDLGEELERDMEYIPCRHIGPRLSIPYIQASDLAWSAGRMIQIPAALTVRADSKRGVIHFWSFPLEGNTLSWHPGLHSKDYLASLVLLLPLLALELYLYLAPSLSSLLCPSVAQCTDF